MRDRDQILLEGAYDEVNQSKLNALKDFRLYELRSVFWDAIAYEVENNAAAILDQDYARSGDVLDYLASLEPNTEEIKTLAVISSDVARENLEDQGSQWNQEIDQQFLDFFHKTISSSDSKVLEALSQRDDYTKELDQILNK